ncbi:mitochondrial ribosomal death-associated protein 3-domain-containing protein [Amylocarpus encephaloides]|uniref:Small ribosomal subunit protein mS29 n=1 Tax=Amylocarpus encephaloides TaxID=45428 RepID=A0A9P7YD91_9HELO|nr:mitochondrial ribosomal death-associated protein 3-domain-containing protein [Amylocarpus encephaloides]
MSTSTTCWKCLSRPSLLSSQLSSRIAQVTVSAPFSSTATSLAPPLIRGNNGPQKGVKGTTAIKKKNRPQQTGKPPMPGERKALRKRVVLSNTNAIEVQDLVDLNQETVDGLLKENASGEYTSPVAGKVVGLPGTTVDSLRAIESFKTSQGWGLFRRPSLLVRKEAIDLTKSLVSAAKDQITQRLIIDGARGTGKSLMLLHAQAAAFAQGWVVINIPEARELVSATSDYAPIPDTMPQLWTQPTFTSSWLEKIQKANKTQLDTLKMTKKHNLPIEVPSEISLSRFLEIGVSDTDVAWPIFQAFWDEMNAKDRPPMLLTMDSTSYVMGMTEYRDKAINFIHSHDFVITKLFMDLFSGAIKMNNGGAVIAATSRSNSPTSISMDLAIMQALQRQAGEKLTRRNPFERKYDERVDSALRDITVMELSGVSKAEARSLMEYWAASGVLRQRVDEQIVAEKWALAGNGVIGEIKRNALNMRI